VDLEVGGNVRYRTDFPLLRGIYRFGSVHNELISELSATNKRFGAMNKELQDANEELQATNEEFEATNEELQATNEELETNNEELQATNEELQTTNDELSARTAELQELARQHRLEQMQIATLLERYPHYIMVLNAEDLTIQSINPAYQQLLGTRDVKGLLMSEVFTGNHVDDLMKALRTAVRDSQTLTTGPILASVNGDQSDRPRFTHTIVPISDASGASVTRLFVYSEKVE
jgi:myosin heavy subunit